ncbi:MAG: DUF3089 domain-containing protein [Erythrobacter sp.]
MARKFLWIIAALIVIALAVLFALRIWASELAEVAFVPTTEFTQQEALQDNAYDDPSLWYSRPGMGTNDPARWQPAIQGERTDLPVAAEQSLPDYAVFFVHPTSYLNRNAWNAPAGDAEAERVAKLYVRGMASAFNAADEIWAPRYRQATMGAFLTDAPEAEKAIEAAYADVAQAYAYFRSSIDADTPIVLVGHSQGSLHLLRLLREEIAGSQDAQRIAAAYVVGWPISLERDLPQLPLPACQSADQSGCIMSWSSFAEPADPSDVLETYAASIGFDGEARGQSSILCTNPLTGGARADAEQELNLGTLVPEDDLSTGELVPRAVPARCDDRGLLLIGDPPEMGSYVLPGNNYHVYDIPLFWANTKADVASRVDAWSNK